MGDVYVWHVKKQSPDGNIWRVAAQKKKTNADYILTKFIFLKINTY